MDFDGFPLVVGWELTLRCNLRCLHCASAAAEARPGELSLEEALAICDQFPALLVQEVDFTGGEPLLHPHWREIAARLASLGIPVQVLTNGLSLTPETLSALKDVGIHAVAISLDGLEGTHDTIRGHSGLFRKVLAAVERAQSAGFRVIVITTVNALNLGELPEMARLLLARGIPQWQIQPIFPLGRARANSALELTPGSCLRLGHFVREWQGRAMEGGLDIVPSDPYGYYTEFDVRPVPWQGCPAGRAACGIMSNGKVKGCLSLPDTFIEGDLRERDLWDIWFDPNAFAYTRRFTPSELGPFCQGCELAEQCMGGCSAMSYGATGAFHNNPFCFTGILSRAEA